uniref:Uncharacterized protein n=1 Tax=Spongospora subterranea TaxID=70186 RepID=A0A0H5QU90_9EUKA|eukprot:CRZ05465.1 hypothetical protein [Spongospora subterranea]
MGNKLPDLGPVRVDHRCGAVEFQYAGCPEGYKCENTYCIAGPLDPITCETAELPLECVANQGSDGQVHTQAAHSSDVPAPEKFIEVYPAEAAQTETANKVTSSATSTSTGVLAITAFLAVFISAML